MPRGSDNGGISLRITDFSDRELLAIVNDLQNRDGEVDITRVAEQIWPKATSDENMAWHARHCVAIRFAYMRRMGVIDKITGKSGFWELTEFGREFVRGRATAAQARAISGANVGQELEVMSLVGDLYERVDDDAATLMRREFQFRAYRRRWR